MVGCTREAEENRCRWLSFASRWSAGLLLGVASSGWAATTVVATVFPLADILRQIGGDRVAVHTLLPAGANPHTFEPTPEQLRLIGEAALVVRVGAGLDEWTDGLLRARSTPPCVFTAVDGVALLGPADSKHGDPHVWLDPILVRDEIVPRLVRALSEVDAAGQGDFERGGAAFAAQLTQLDRDISVGLLSLTQRGFVAVHPAWRYFARRYGLDEIAVVEDSPGKEPSAQTIAAIVRRARAQHARVVLTEPQLSRRMADVLAEEIGASVVTVDPLGGPAVAGRDSYLALMRYNLHAFEQALR